MLLPTPHSSEAVASSLRDSAEPRRSGRVEELQRQVERLMSRLCIAVVFGGDKSTEGAVINPTFNPRSWKSYQFVAEDIASALERIGFQKVHVVPEDMQLGERLRKLGVHVAWLNSGGVQGYNPMAHAAAMLEMFGIPYVGHDPLTVGMLDNKHVFKRELTALGFPTSPFVVSHFASGPFDPGTNRRFQETFAGYDGQFVVKPVTGRASLHVIPVANVAQLGGTVAQVHQATENHVLIEKYLPGREFCVAACGPVTARRGKLARHAGPFVFAAVERVLEPDELIFTSMDLRPITSERILDLDPVADSTLVKQLNDLANEVYRELNLEALIRLDLRMDEEGRLMILEANPKPDLRFPDGETTSLVCANLEAYGMNYDDLILSLLADRIDLLFSKRRQSATQLASLLEAS